MKYIFIILTFLFNVAFFNSCSSSSNTVNGNSEIGNASFSDPRYVEGELVVILDSIEVLKGNELKKFNIAHSLPENQKPTLLLWSSQIIDRKTQKDVKTLEFLPKPTETFIDSLDGNKISFWNLSDSALTKSKILVKRKFSYITYDYKPRINKKLVEEKWQEIPEEIKYFYTKDENFLPTGGEIDSLSKVITSGMKNPVDKTRAIFNWLRKNLTYVYPPKKRGAIEILHTREGDCGQYSNLFISLSRAAGIPARQQSGFNFVPGNTGYHAWSEVYFPVYGWVPVDATRKDGFCHLDNKRLIASVGMNIPLHFVPKWASNVTNEIIDRKADFMQLVTIVKSGIQVNIKTERNILKSMPLNEAK